MQLIMCMENGKWCTDISYKARGYAYAQLTGNSAPHCFPVFVKKKINGLSRPLLSVLVLV
jgi:uncharacterized protein YraI